MVVALAVVMVVVAAALAVLGRRAVDAAAARTAADAAALAAAAQSGPAEAAALAAANGAEVIAVADVGGDQRVTVRVGDRLARRRGRGPGGRSRWHRRSDRTGAGRRVRGGRPAGARPSGRSWRRRRPTGSCWAAVGTAAGRRRSSCGAPTADRLPTTSTRSPRRSADRPTARPGHSMHELGLAVDFTYQGSVIVSGVTRRPTCGWRPTPVATGCTTCPPSRGTGA